MRGSDAAVAVTAASWLAVALALGAPAPASASDALDVSVEGSLGLVHVHSAVMRPAGLVALSAAASYYEEQDATPGGGPGCPGSATLRLAGSAGVAPWLELAVDAALVRSTFEGDRGSGLVHPAIAVKAGGLTPAGRLNLAVEGRVELPWGSEVLVGPGVDTALVSGGDADASVLALATLDLTGRLPVRLHANVGWAFRGNADRGRTLFPDTYPPVPGGGRGDNDALLLRGAVEFPGRRATLFTEIRGDLLRDRSLVATKENPLLVTPGVRVRFGSWAATAALSVGLSGNDRSTPGFDPFAAYPDWMATASLSWGWPAFAPDADGDGVEDYRDLCPRAPEDPDGFADGDGCPDPDNDRDGIADEMDLDPFSPEDIDGFEDEDGIPDPDNDRDGTLDSRDMCPDESEDPDGFEDEDGCPDR